MIDITNPSSTKAFIKCFIVLMIIATVVIYNYCGNIITKEVEQETVIKKTFINEDTIAIIESFINKDTEITIEPMTTIPVMASPEELANKIIINSKEDKIEKNYDKDISSEQDVVVNTRENTLYYVIDSGYEIHLNDEYQDHLYNMCIKYNVKEYYSLLLAQMYHESGFNKDVISSTNDYGLMQINKCNHNWLGKILGNYNFLDPYNSIEAGVYMMSIYLHKYNDVEKALVCYNMGEGAVKKGRYSTTYSRGVLDDMNLLVEKE